MTQEKTKPAPPVPVIILCLLGFLMCFLRMFTVLAPQVREVSPLYPPYISMTTLYLIFVLYGFWMMRRWSLWAFAAYFLAQAAVSWAFHFWTPNAVVISLAFPLALVLASAFYYRRMT